MRGKYNHFPDDDHRPELTAANSAFLAVTAGMLLWEFVKLAYDVRSAARRSATR